MPGADVTPGSSPRTTRSGAGRPPTPFGIATLEEVLEEFPGVVLNLDIKQTAPVVAALRGGAGRAAGQSSRADRRRHRGLVPGLGHRGLLGGSPGYRDLGRHRGDGRVLPGRPHGRGTATDLATSPSRCRRAYGELILVDERFVEAAHAAGLAVHVWTVEEPTAMERLCGLGVDGIISDRPTVLAACWPPGCSVETGYRVS